MSMFGDIATEAVVRKLCVELALRLDACRNNYVADELRSVGRFTLTLFDWTTPEWAATYEELFRGPRVWDKGAVTETHTASGRSVGEFIHNGKGGYHAVDCAGVPWYDENGPTVREGAKFVRKRPATPEELKEHGLA